LKRIAVKADFGGITITCSVGGGKRVKKKIPWSHLVGRQEAVKHTFESSLCLDDLSIYVAAIRRLRRKQELTQRKKEKPNV